MGRRRLRMVSSSDEEDDERTLTTPPPPPPPQQNELPDEEMNCLIMDDIEMDLQTVTLNSGNPIPSSNNSTTASATSTSYRQGIDPIPLDISDDEPENNTIGDSTDNSFSGIVNGNNQSVQVSESPVHGILERLGLKLRGEWLDSCLQGLQESVQGFQRMDDSAKAKLCFQQFLWSDMNFCGAGVLPPNVHTLHSVNLRGPFVLQIDEIVNISSPLRGRYQNAAPGIKRCLKLSMTDGIQRVFGMEYRPIKDFQVLGPAGLKVVVCNVNIRHGLLMLVPEVVEVLGGTVDELEGARQRLVEEVNKPPRGRRTRTGEVPPLTTRATLAAWPPCNDAVPAHADGSHPANTVPLQSSRPGSAGSTAASHMHRQDFATPVSRNDASLNTAHAPWPSERSEIPGHIDTPMIVHLQRGTDRLSQRFETPMGRSNVEPIPGDRINAEPIHGAKSNDEPSTVSRMETLQSVPIAQHINEPNEVLTGVTTPLGRAGQDIPANCISGEDVHVPANRDGGEPKTSPIYVDAEEIFMDDSEHHFILSRDLEIPFTYMASLSAKCVASDVEPYVVRGKIKCVITAVKRFQYKQRTTFELLVYIDDGSLISEIIIDHNVVRNAIGYSPQEITSALTSSEDKRVNEMKTTLTQFQIFLMNFEGTMIVEMNKASDIAVAVEMEQGCPASDARLLLERVKSFNSQQQQTSQLNPIDLSP